MKTIITCAVTGAHTTPKHNPNLPVTSDQIADSALAAAEAGAAIVHVHVRDPDTAAPSMELDHYRDVVQRIRKHNPDLLINLTTGPGATGPVDSVVTGSDRFKSAQQRVAHVLDLRPEICSLDFNTMNRGLDQITVNALPVVREMARLIRDVGVKPELEIFDSGDMSIAKSLINDGLITGRPLIQIATGVKWGWESTVDTLAYAKRLMPADATWYAFGIGSKQMPFAALSLLNGGHVRVGFEDNVFVSRRILAESNAQLVTKARRIIEDLGNTVATCQDAREILQIERSVN